MKTILIYKGERMSHQTLVEEVIGPFLSTAIPSEYEPSNGYEEQFYIADKTYEIIIQSKK